MAVRREVIVIGPGIVGASIAWHLDHRDPLLASFGLERLSGASTRKS